MRPAKAFILLAGLLLPLAAHCAGPAQPFIRSGLNPSGVLLLKAGPEYSAYKSEEKKAAVERAAAAFPSASVVSVESAGEGELWSIAGSSATALDSWSDRQMHFGPHSRRAGRWFGYFGGQLTRGGDLPANLWVGRLGTTLLKDRYDAAVSLSRNNSPDVDDSAVTTVGLTFRALYPYTRHAGFNLGAQLDRVSATGYNHLSPSALGGINVYLPGGSFDVTLTFGEEGRSGMLVGYTVFITK